MKVNAFKQLIKEAVAEAVREELHAIFDSKPQPIQEAKTFNFSSNDVMAGGLPSDVRNSLRAKMGMTFGFEQPQQTQYNHLDIQPAENNKNPYLNFIADAANNMSAQDLAGLRNLDT
jgi:hypothetical protein